MKLTPTEKLYLEALEKADGAVSLEELVAIKPVPQLRMSNLVAANIKNLRKKVAGKFEIVSVRGYGYVLKKV